MSALEVTDEMAAAFAQEWFGDQKPGRVPFRKEIRAALEAALSAAASVGEPDEGVQETHWCAQCVALTAKRDTAAALLREAATHLRNIPAMSEQKDRAMWEKIEAFVESLDGPDEPAKGYVDNSSIERCKACHAPLSASLPHQCPVPVAVVDEGAIGLVPFLPTHDHDFDDEPCHDLCAVAQWKAHRERWGDPYTTPMFAPSAVPSVGLRERIAEALWKYSEAQDGLRWDVATEEQRGPWLADADACLSVLLEAGTQEGRWASNARDLLEGAERLLTKTASYGDEAHAFAQEIGCFLASPAEAGTQEDEA